MEMIGKVRRMKLREQLSNSEIAKRTGLSRNTVKKWLKAPGEQAPKYKRWVFWETVTGDSGRS
jgi:transposase